MRRLFLTPLQRLRSRAIAPVSVALLPAILGLTAPPARAQPAYGPYTCGSGYVWREAFPADHVCVTPAKRAEVVADNAAPAGRRAPGGGDTCIPGYVWREASPADLVCVTPATRQAAEEDNLDAVRRFEDPALAAGADPHELGTCKPGYVWREASPADLVCVTPETRQQAAEDKRQADARRQPPTGDPFDSPYLCRQGYVNRLAFPGDFVCVTPATRAQVRADNAAAASRLASPESVTLTAETYQTGGPGLPGFQLFAYGSGFSSNGGVQFYALGLRGAPGPDSVGSVNTRADGTFGTPRDPEPLDTEICRRGQGTAPVTIVALDRRNGRVVTAGITDRYWCRGE